MVVNQRVTGRASTMPAGLAVGAIISLAVTVAGSAATAWMLNSQKIREASIGYCAMVILLLSSSSGAAAAVARVKRRKMMVCCLNGCMYYLCLLSLTALFFGAQYQGIGVTGLIIMCGSILVAMVGAGQGRGRKHPHR